MVDLGQEVKPCFHSYTVLIVGLMETPLEAQPPEPVLLRLEEVSATALYGKVGGILRIFAPSPVHMRLHSDWRALRVRATR